MTAPRTITRSQYVALIEALELDPAKIIVMRLDAHGIFAEMIAEPDDPEVHLFEQGELPKKPVFIKVVDG